MGESCEKARFLEKRIRRLRRAPAALKVQIGNGDSLKRRKKRSLILLMMFLLFLEEIIEYKENRKVKRGRCN